MGWGSTSGSPAPTTHVKSSLHPACVRGVWYPLVAPSFQSTGKYLAASVHLEQSNSQQNVWYLERIEVQTISNSGDSPTYLATSHIFLKQYNLIISGDSPTYPAAPHSPFKRYSLIKPGDSPTFPFEPYGVPDCSFEQNCDAEFRRLLYGSVTNVGPVRGSDRSSSTRDVQIAMDHNLNTSGSSSGYAQ